MKSDSPIFHMKDDELGRGDFALRLANALRELPPDASYVFGLHGSWGSGKTSLINLVAEALKEDTNLKKMAIVRFDPWSNLGSTDMAMDFFETIKESIDITYEGEWATKIGEAISRYAAPLSGLGTLVQAVQGVPVGPAIEAVASSGSQALLLKGEKDLGSISLRKKKVAEALEEKDCRILVVIDNIDRLSNEKIQEVFQLVAAVADFPRVNYLLAFDHEVVVRALGGIQGGACDSRLGEQYLEKIVQVPIAVPLIAKSSIRSIVRNRLNDEFSFGQISHDYGVRGCDKERVLHKCVFPRIGTIREMKRYLNALRFEMSMAVERVNPVDMVGFVAMKTFHPSVINWIHAHKDLFVYGESETNALGVLTEMLESFNRFCESERIIGEEKSDLESALEILFPKYGDVKEGRLHSDRRLIIRQKRESRISDANIFDCCFGAGLVPSDFNASRCVAIVLSNDEEALGRFLQEILSGDSDLDYLDVAVSTVLESSKEKQSSFARVLLDCLSSACVSAELCERLVFPMRDLMSRLDLDESGEIQIECMKKFNIGACVLFAEFMNAQELGYGRLAANGVARDYYQTISLDKLIDLEQIFVERVKWASAFGNNIFALDGNRMLLWLWSQFDGEGFEGYLKERFNEDPFNIVLFVRNYAGLVRTLPYGDRSWSLDRGFEQYISADEVLCAIDKAKEDDRFGSLPEGWVERVISVEINLRKKIGYEMEDEQATTIMVAEEIGKLNSAN